jgi:hypothetical protein
MKMGYSYEGDIERAGTHLLVILMAEGEVRYSRFYDGSNETHEALAEALEVDPDDCPEHLIDLAAWQLEDQEVVSINQLPDKLADEEPNYLITLTEKGRTLLAQGAKFRYYDAE